MQRMRRVFITGMLVLGGAMAAGGLGGCKLFNNSSGGPLIPDSLSPIVDVPVPAGFRMANDSSSNIVPGSGLRRVNHRYIGSDDMMPVVSYFREQMPRKEWTWVDQNQTSGKESVLRFTKKGEECSVTVTERTFDTVIRVKIDPATR